MGEARQGGGLWAAIALVAGSFFSFRGPDVTRYLLLF